MAGGHAHLNEALDRHLAALLAAPGEAWPREAGAAEHVDDIIRRIRFHGIAGLLAGHPETLASLPEALRERVRDDARMQVLWEETHRAMLTRLLGALAQEGIEALLMKGSALAYSLYAEPWCRRRGDSDVLVRKHQLVSTRRVLAALGFVRREDPHGLFFQETWLIEAGAGMVHAVDLHWQPSDSPAMQQVLRADEFFARRQPLPRLSPDAAAPDPVLTFLHGAINQAWHAAKGYFVGDERILAAGRLIWAWDNHLLASHFSEKDWERLADTAIARDVAGIVVDALALPAALFASPVPPMALARLRAAPAQTALVRHLRQTDLIKAFFTDLGAIASPLDKCRFVLGHAFPDPRHLRQKYADSAGTPIILLHARRIAESGWRWLGRR